MEADEESWVIPDVEDVVDNAVKRLNQQPAYDKLIHAEISFQIEEINVAGKVKGRTLGPDGRTDAIYHEYPRRNSMIYDAEFPDGKIKEYSANMVAGNMLTHIDSEGMSTSLMESTADFQKDNSALSKEDKYLVTPRGQRRMQKNTKVWKLLVIWKDQSKTWNPLKDLKESNPVEVAEFAKAWCIQDEPTFCWWVPYFLK